MNCFMLMKKIFATAFLNILVFGGLFAQQRAENNTRRIGLFVGANEGNPARQQKLEFAQSDAESVSKIFFELGGINREDIDNNVLLQPNRALLEWRLDAIKNELTGAKRNGQRTELIFYYAGHSDGININLGVQSYPTAILLEKIQNIEADARIVILDMCYAGGVGRGTAVPLVSDGCIVLTSTRENEESWEIREIKTTLFTHSLVTGLRGAADANGDTNVTLKELYDFVNKEVRIKTSDQNPQLNNKSPSSEETALTSTWRAKARFIIGGDVIGRVIIWDNVRKISVSDLTKEQQSVMELAFEFGDYQLRLYRENPSRWVSQRLRETNSNINLQMKDFFPGGIAALWNRLTSRGAETAVNFYEPPPEYSAVFSASNLDPAAPEKAMPIDAALVNAAGKISASIPGNAKVAIDISSNHADLTTYIRNELTKNMNNTGFEVVARSKDEIDAINRELDRQMSGYVRDETQIPLGQNTGADTIITGSVVRNSETTYRLYVNAIKLENGSFYPNSIYSASVLNDGQMQRLTGNWSDSIVYPSASSVQGLYFDFGGGYGWSWTNVIKVVDGPDMLHDGISGNSDFITINLTEKYFFTQKIGVALYASLDFPQKSTTTTQGTSISPTDYNGAYGFNFLLGPIIMLYKSEKIRLPLSLGISWSYSHFDRESASDIGLGTNITGDYYFSPHLYGYLRFQLDFGGYTQGSFMDIKGTVNGSLVSKTITYSYWSLSLGVIPSIGIGYKW